jgi:hypothetical protein
VAERALREASEGTLESVWAEVRHLRQRIDDLDTQYQQVAQAVASGQAPPGELEGVGPLAITVARALSRTAARYPRAASLARGVLGIAIGLRRKLGGPRGS